MMRGLTVDSSHLGAEAVKYFFTIKYFTLISSLTDRHHRLGLLLTASYLQMILMIWISRFLKLILTFRILIWAKQKNIKNKAFFSQINTELLLRKHFH